MAQRNILAAILLIAFGVFYAVLIIGLPLRNLPGTLGPAFFPWLIVSLLLVLSAALLAQALMQYVRGTDRQLKLFDGSKDTAVLLGLFVVYLAILPYVGFEIASIPFFACLMVLFGARNWMVIAVTALATPIILGAIFRQIFQILLPRGALIETITSWLGG